MLKVSPDYFLDITDEVCPMTFVKTRLLIEKMSEGETAEIVLRGEEPISNVPRSIAELGHTIESQTTVAPGEEGTPGDVVLIIRKSPTG